MFFSGLGWRSLDPREAVADVHSIDDRNMLIRIAYEAMHPEARRMALIKLNDKNLTESFALSDRSPIVRRRMVRMIDDREVLKRIIDNDSDRTVVSAACERMDFLNKQE